MSPAPESLPPIRFSLGGRLWQFYTAIVFMAAGFALIFVDWLPFKEAIPILIPLSVYFLYIYWKEATVVIFKDRVEFGEFRTELQVIKFTDITKLESEQRYRQPNKIYLTKKSSGREERIPLPYVYKDTFEPLKKYLQKWHGDPQQVLHSLRVRFENQGWAFLRMRFPPMATRIMAWETSIRCS